MKLLDNLHGFFWNSMTVNNCNTYLIDGPTRILIDPGHFRLFDHVRQGLDELGLTIEDIGMVIITHAHPDHIEGIQHFKETNAQIALHEKEWDFLKSMEKYIHATFGMDTSWVKPHVLLKEGMLSVNGMDFDVFHTPGHSPGSLCFYWREPKVLFCGDVIFKEGLGRTDLPGGNGRLLKQSIQTLSNIDIEYVLPGHGEIISGSREVQMNFQQIENFWFNYI